ncbi:MAG: hypothetical protein ACREQ5_08935 [Candidatus Dormibacteria bacterium]
MTIPTEQIDKDIWKKYLKGFKKLDEAFQAEDKARIRAEEKKLKKTSHARRKSLDEWK